MHIANAEIYSSHVFLVPGFDKQTEQCHAFYRGRRDVCVFVAHNLY